ncbi:MAG: hypothetical protein ACYDDB_01215 [bacterium]
MKKRLLLFVLALALVLSPVASYANGLFGGLIKPKTQSNTVKLTNYNNSISVGYSSEHLGGNITDYIQSTVPSNAQLSEYMPPVFSPVYGSFEYTSPRSGSLPGFSVSGKYLINSDIYTKAYFNYNNGSIGTAYDSINTANYNFGIEGGYMLFTPGNSDSALIPYVSLGYNKIDGTISFSNYDALIGAKFQYVIMPRLIGELRADYGLTFGSNLSDGVFGSAGMGDNGTYGFKAKLSYFITDNIFVNADYKYLNYEYKNESAFFVPYNTMGNASNLTIGLKQGISASYIGVSVGYAFF